MKRTINLFSISLCIIGTSFFTTPAFADQPKPSYKSEINKSILRCFVERDGLLFFDTAPSETTPFDDFNQTISSQEALEILILFIQGLIVNAQTESSDSLDFLNSLNENLTNLISIAVDISLNFDPYEDSEPLNVKKSQKKDDEDKSPSGREKAELILNTFANIIGSVAQIVGDPQNPATVGQGAGNIVGAIVNAAKESAHKNNLDEDEDFQNVANYLQENKDLHENVSQMLTQKAILIHEKNS